jgi:hypothetical protein
MRRRADCNTAVLARLPLRCCTVMLFPCVSLVSQRVAGVIETVQETRVMRYRDHEIRYESENDNLEAEFVRQQSSGKQYRRKRSIRATRRSTKASVTKPGCGIGARRHHRWTW